MKIIPLIIAFGITSIFIYCVFRPCPFNWIGYLIYETIWNGGTKEALFIKGFDLVCAAFLFGGTYAFVKKVQNK